jgi:predicted DNA-binding transcriptional regulator YafY
LIPPHFCLFIKPALCYDVFKGGDQVPEQAITKTERILSIYHLLTYCDEVSMQELTSLLPVSKKTFTRDIAVLKKAGVQVRYSVKRQAFVLTGHTHTVPATSESKSEARYIAKIVRLITCMDDLPSADCDVWYMDNIPRATKRTMQRDFATLNAIGYSIKYERENFNSHDVGNDVPIRSYYCDRPNGAFALSSVNSVF